MPIIKWNPFTDIQDIFEETKVGWDCAVDVYEEKNNVIVEMNIPGIHPDKFDIDVEDDLLHVSGTREKKEEVEDKNYYRKEIHCGSFSRNIHLPSAVQADKTIASYENGVLKITLPKKSAAPAKKVKVNVKK